VSRSSSPPPGRRIPTWRKAVYSAGVLVVVVAACEVASGVILRHTQLGRRVEARPPMDAVVSWSGPPAPPPTLELKDDLWLRTPEPPTCDHPHLVTSLPDGPLAVLVGGSAPHGHGVLYDQTFWALLDAARVSGLTFSNGAMPSYSASGSAHQLRWAFELGDVALAAIYVGDNEWNGFLYPSGLGPGPLERLDHLMLASRAYALGAGLVRHELDRRRPRMEPITLEQTWGLSDYCLEHRYQSFDVFGVDQVERLRRRLEDNFSGWVELMLTAAADERATVLLMTTPIRYRLSPCYSVPQIVSEAHAGTATEGEIVRLLRQGYAALKAGDPDAALGPLDAAAALDPGSSLTNHYLGYAFERLGRVDEARRHFGVARNRTIGGSGILLDLNRILRQKATAHAGAVLVDLQQLFDDHADRHGLGLGDELFLDWCHPSPLGHRVIADALERVIPEALAARPAAG